MRTSRMWSTAGVALVVFALFVRATGPWAADPRVDRQAWAQTSAAPTFVPQDGELYVSAVAGAEEARTFVHIDVGGLAREQVEGSLLVLRESAAGGVVPDTARVAACALAAPIPTSGRLPGPIPAADCAQRTLATRATTGVWTVDLAPFAERWAGGDNHGLVLFPDVLETTTTWRVVWTAENTALELGPAPTMPVGGGEDDGSSDEDVDDPTATDAGDTAFPAYPGDAGLLLPDPTTAEPTGPVPVAPSEPVAQVDDEPDVRPRPAGRSTTGSSVAVMLLLALVAVALLTATPLRRRVVLPSAPMAGTATFVRPVLLSGVALLPLLFREVIIYKAGVALVFFVAAMGLHVLVNWAGQLSLAHAGMVGLSAFTVLALSEVHGISPVYLLPVAALVGAASGALVALPTLRAKGLQVTLVTLVAGIAIDQYFFRSEWLVGGAAGRAAAIPTIGPFEFATSRSLYPVLLVFVAGAVALMWALMHSKAARAWQWVQANPDAASAFGIPVVLYRISAYAVGGAFAGLAGGLSVMWVQRLTPSAFPTTLSFSYLLVVVLAGPGFLGGVAMATWILQGMPLFAPNMFGVDVGKLLDRLIIYGGPLALIDMLGRSESGLNGRGRRVMERMRAALAAKRARTGQEATPQPVSLSLAGGVFFIVTGFVAIALAWRHSSQTNQLWVQNQEILSGGVGGLGSILVGVGLLLRDRLGRNQDLLIERLEQVLAAARPGLVPSAPAAAAAPSAFVDADLVVDEPQPEAPAAVNGSRRRRTEV